MKRLASFVMQGLSQSVMVTSVLAMFSLIFPLIGILSTASVGLVSLRQGGKAGAMTAAGSTLACGLLMFLIFGNALPAMGFLLLQWLPIGLLALFLRNSRSLALTTQISLGFGLLIVLGQYVSLGNPAEFWREQLEPMAQRFVEAGLFNQAQSVEAINQLSVVMCGVVAAGFLLQLLLSLYLARWWQALLYNPGGFATEFQQLRCHKALGLLGAAVLTLWLIPGMALSEVVSCLGAVVLPVFLLQGLAVAHSVFGKLKSPLNWLVATYVLLLVFMPQMAMVLVTIGLLDVWLDFRARYPGKLDSG
ncbi:MAG: DUF2232 domain-containing protein [Candidatus Thiodiazotropha sp. (ex Myrtea spinifera)]|nr:DUF2232 domain-containing protein [Candidatus Thiodiazotropha sp. (ex Myrtea spinifera)]MCU7829350.1 DUF2232 domain-containing protein [Candidatus Thiodiazotropha sp. (ex Myrtea sp. 'scaly one' KF741663)]